MRTPDLGLPRGGSALRRWAFGLLRPRGAPQAWFLMVAAGLVVDGLVALATGALSDSALGYAFGFFSMTVGMDSWGPMLSALAHLHGPSPGDVYGTLFFTEHVKFQYPLTSLLGLEFLAANPCHCVSPVRVMWLLSKLSVVGTGVVAVLLLYGASPGRVSGGSAPAPAARPSRRVLVLAGVASLAFYPLTRGDHLGQIQTLMTFVAALALLAQQRGRPWAAGVLIGICCTIKPQWAFAILWAVMTRQWRFAGAAATVVSLFGAGAIARYGWQNVVDYLPVLKQVALHGESFYANQSINGLLHRLLSNGNNLEWLGHSFAPFHPAVYLATVLSSVALLGAVFFTASTAVARAEPLALVVVTLSLASPIVWDHHYGVMLPVLALVFPTWFNARGERWGPLALLGAAYLLIATNLSPLANTTALGPMNILQSYQLFGGIVLLTVMHRTCWLKQQEIRLPFASLRGAVGGWRS